MPQSGRGNTLNASLVAESGMRGTCSGDSTSKKADGPHEPSAIFGEFQPQLKIPRPATSDTTNSTRNTKNRILANWAAVPATPPKPSAAATKEISRKTSA